MKNLHYYNIILLKLYKMKVCINPELLYLFFTFNNYIMYVRLPNDCSNYRRWPKHLNIEIPIYTCRAGFH